MQNQKALSIDLFQTKSPLQILQQAPLLSSDSAGWNGIRLRHYHLPPYELLEYSPQQNVIIAHYQNRLSVERTLDGQTKSLEINRGDLTIVPANTSHTSRWHQALEIVVLVLDPEFMAHVASEWIDPNLIRLAPHFSSPDPFISQICLLLKNALTDPTTDSRFYAESMAVALSAHSIEHYSVKEFSAPNYLGGLPRHKLREAKEYIIDRLDKDISLESIANRIGMSRYHFSRMFKQSTGLTPYQYLIECRLKKTKELLVNTDLSIADIADITGFSTHSHLTKTFRQHLSVTPKKYRQMQ
jgi:AraC family transcriptional regulator